MLRNRCIISPGDMSRSRSDHGLEFLLAFNDRIHHLEKGYWLKFEIVRVAVTTERLHGLSYSFTLRSRFKRRRATTDHWHRTERDTGRPYEFTTAERLLDDFFDEVEGVLGERGVSLRVTKDEESRRSK